MSIEVTARHMDAASDVQEYANEKAEGIVSDFPTVESVHVILDVEKHRQIAEFVVQAKGHIRISASESSDNMFAAIDAAYEKARKQLRKHLDKVQEHR